MFGAYLIRENEATRKLMCPDNSPITGFNIKHEWVTGRSDNVGMTGLAIGCKNDKWTSHDQKWGNWHANWQSVDKNAYYVCGAKAAYEPKRENGSPQDETRLHALWLKACRYS